MKHRRELAIDIETSCSANLSKAGVYRYTEAEDFRILLFGYAVDNGPVQVVDLEHGESIPDYIINGIRIGEFDCFCFNSSFERICISRFLGMPTGTYLNPDNWYCTQIWSLYLGLPPSLAGVGKVLGLEEQKMEEGNRLIRKFCMGHTLYEGNVGTGARTNAVHNARGSCLPLTDSSEACFVVGKDMPGSGEPTAMRNLPPNYKACPGNVRTRGNEVGMRNAECAFEVNIDPDWELFKSYNKRDVEVEMAIRKKLSRFPVPDWLWDEYHLSERINDRGIGVDMQLVKNAIAIDDARHYNRGTTAKERNINEIHTTRIPEVCN